MQRHCRSRVASRLYCQTQQRETTFNNGGSLCPPSSPAASTSIGPAGLVGIGAGAGLGVAALALAAFFAYKRMWAPRRAVDAAPLLGGRKAIGMVDI